MEKSQIKKVAIASILKPVDDTRGYEKIGVTLADSGDYEVYMIGYPSHTKNAHQHVHFLPLERFPRLSFARLLARFKVLQLILQVKPQLLIINSHELLLVSFLNRIFFGTKIIYDVQENYYRNIRLTPAFPSVFRTVLALWVRLKEKVFAPFIHGFFLAEKGYEKELKFFGKNRWVLENKSVVNLTAKRPKKNSDFVRLLFSGTLAESTGVFSAIRLAKNLHKADSRVQLRIIGHCPQPGVLSRLRDQLQDAPFITLEGGDHLVPHPKIIDAINEADFGIIYYPPAAHTENSIPTKLYEYLAQQLPILIQPHPVWSTLVRHHQAGIAIDFNNPDIATILNSMTSDFYPEPPSGVAWTDEVSNLFAAVKKVLAV